MESDEQDYNEPDESQAALRPEERAALLVLGRRLRAARRRCGWSLATMAQRSGGRFKPSAVANYERGDRVLSAVRLVQLADLYGATTVELLGQDTGTPPLIDLTRRGPQKEGPPARLPHLVIDIAALERSPRSPDIQIVWNLVRSLRAQRNDPGPSFSLRAADVAHLARALARTPASIAAELAGAVVEFDD